MMMMMMGLTRWPNFFLLVTYAWRAERVGELKGGCPAQNSGQHGE